LYVGDERGGNLFVDHSKGGAQLSYNSNITWLEPLRLDPLSSPRLLAEYPHFAEAW